MESFFYCICLRRIINLNRLLQFIYTICILLEILAESILTYYCISILNNECESLKILFSYFTLNSLRDVDVTGLDDLLVIVLIIYCCRLGCVFADCIECCLGATRFCCTINLIAYGNGEAFYSIERLLDRIILRRILYLNRCLKFICSVSVLLEIYAKLI